MSRKAKPPAFKIGDRVAEKPKPRAMLTNSAETKERISAYRSQRYGTVLDTVYKQNARGSKVPYVKVIWDGGQSPSLHSQNRLCPEKDLSLEMQSYFNGND
jgi:hypothetical protein